MGASKTETYSESELQLAKFAKALSHPARIAILQLLIQKQACMCGDIVDELPIAQSTVSQHLRELKSAGLIKGEIEGPAVCYCINETAWTHAQQTLGKLFGSLKETSRCC